MRDYDAEKRFLEKVYYVMSKCQYRRDMDGVGVCSLNVAPCSKVLYDGNCETVAEWFQRGHRKGEKKTKEAENGE